MAFNLLDLGKRLKDLFDQGVQTLNHPIPQSAQGGIAPINYGQVAQNIGNSIGNTELGLEKNIPLYGQLQSGIRNTVAPIVKNFSPQVSQRYQSFNQPDLPGILPAATRFVGSQVPYIPLMLATEGVTNPLTSKLGSLVPKGTTLAGKVGAGATKSAIQFAPYGWMGGLDYAKNGDERLQNIAKSTVSNIALGGALGGTGGLVKGLGDEVIKLFPKSTPEVQKQVIDRFLRDVKTGQFVPKTPNNLKENVQDWVRTSVGKEPGSPVFHSDLVQALQSQAGFIKPDEFLPKVKGRSQVKNISGQELPDLIQGKSGKVKINQPKLNLQGNTRGQNPLIPEGIPGVSASLPNNTRNVLNGANVKERGFITSVKESTKTPPEVKALVEGTYVPRSGEELRTTARKLIKSDPATAEQLALNPQNDTHIQIGNELLDHYYATGQSAKANVLSEQMAKGGTEFGRAVQAFANYDKTTPAGAVRFAQSKVNEYNRLNPEAKLKINDSQVKALFDKAHSIQQMPEGRERNIAANELMTQVNNLIPSSIADKVITVWKAGLLTSLRTHERNLVGNTIHGVAEVAKDIPANIADRLMSLRTGQRSTTFTLKGISSGTKKGLLAGKDIITKGYDPEESIAKYDIGHITWGNNPIEQGLKKYTESVFRTLGAEDKPFYNASFGRSLYDQAQTAALNAGKSGDKTFIEGLVKNPTPEMLQGAVKDAEVATFHNKTKLSTLANAIQGFKPAGIPVGQVVAPFTGVPSSIAGQMVAYSPAGLIKGIATAGKVVTKNVPELQRQAAQEIGRGVIGTGLVGLGAYLASKGLITGQPKDAQEAAQWQLENKPANSILIGGKWRSIGSIGPENLIMLAGAKSQEELSKPDGSVGNLAGNLGKDFLGQTFLQGVQQPLAAINDPARYGQSYIGNLGSSIIPNIVKDTSKAFDPYARENNKLSDYFTNSIPGLRNQNIIKRDNLGNPIPQEPTGIGAFTDLLNSKTPIKNPVVDELSRLNNVGNNATPSKLGSSQTINGQKMKLSPEQLNVLESKVGSQATQALNQLFQNPDYQKLSDEEKAKAVDSIITAVRKQVRGTVDLSNQNPTAQSKKQISTASNGLSGQYTLIDPTTGNVKRIDLSKQITAPTATGIDALDKLATAKYNSALSTRASDIYALYQDGKITKEQAGAELQNLSDQKITKAKKPRKISIKVAKARGTKINIRKSSAKKPTFKLTKAPTFKLKKSKKVKLKLTA